VTEKATIECATHGRQQETFVCQHIVLGLQEKRRVGFFWSADDPDDPRPDAWCADCEERVEQTGGEWIGEAAEHLGAQILCGACYDKARVFHMGGNPWS
jgi:hypothetical protein